MRRRGVRTVRLAAVLLTMGAVTCAAAWDLLSRWRNARVDGLFATVWRGSRRLESQAMSGDRRWSARRLSPVPFSVADPRLAPLREAAGSWVKRIGPRRVVVDQVCLVPDVPSFFEAIAAWDDRHYFPILIDEPGWTLPFLRAFRPARVVRFEARGDRRASTAGLMDRWMEAALAVSRAWSPSSIPDRDLPPAGAPPRGLGPTPPALVLSSPDSPMLAGAVALAAGHFQPLLRVEPVVWDLDGNGAHRAFRYGDVLTLPQAWEFARHVEARAAGVVSRYEGLGDDCDFLTIAGDWPYRYDDPVEPAPAQGIQAMDDLIGRVLVGAPDASGLARSRRRWAYAGRLLGDAPASVARAMGALFLQPEMAMVWDTYEPGSERSRYSGVPAAQVLGRARAVPGPVVMAIGQGADLANWDRVMDPSNRFGFLWLNSTGSPTDFTISGGPGHPADLPAGLPLATVMIHSFSAADPADPSTIAGRWLTQGAYLYYGSVNEPYLMAFRLPGLAVDLAVRGVPLSAALRQGESEPMGRPWRLVYLGDPLYRLTRADARPERITPSHWREGDDAHATWAAEAIAPAEADVETIGRLPADRRLQWCRDAAAAHLARDASRPPSEPGFDWRSILLAIPRESLPLRARPALDEMIVDLLSQSGAWDELHARAAAIPPGSRRPKVQAALEAGAIFRLARADREADPVRRRDRIEALRSEIGQASWPSGSPFPNQFARRVEAILRRGGAR